MDEAKYNPELLEKIVRALDLVSDGLAILDGDERLLYYNGAWVDFHDLDPGEDYRGRELKEIEREDAWPVIEEGRDSLYRNGIFIKEFNATRLDGRVQAVQVVANYLDRLDPPLIVIVLRNITELVMAGEHLERYRDKIDGELKRYRDHLEELVEERTRELEKTNRQLKEEIAERLKAEAALVESEDRYRTVTELTSDYTFTGRHDSRGIFTLDWVAGAYQDITGYEADEVESLFSVDRIHPQDRPVCLRHIELMMRGQPNISEMRILTKDNDIRWVLLYGRPTPLEPPEGGVRVTGAVKDITQRKRVEVELETRNKELLLLNKIHEIFDATPRPGEVLEKVIDCLMESCEAETAGVYAYAEAEKEYECVLSRGLPDIGNGNPPGIRGHEQIIRETLEGEGMRLVEENLFAVPGDGGASRIKRTLLFPLQVPHREPRIILIGCPRTEKVAAGKKKFLEIIIKQLALELERRELIEAQQRYEWELRKLTAGLIHSIEEERRQIALNLHDEMGQSVVALNAEFALLEDRLAPDDEEGHALLGKIRKQLQEITESTRQISSSLHPSMLEDLGLVSTLHWFVEKFIASDELEVAIETAGFDEKLPEKLSLALYRVAQEALTNVVRHAQAQKILLKIIKGFPNVIMRIEDDGKGFSKSEAELQGKGLGIVGMRERVAHLNGSFRIDSSPGKGTRIRVALPLEAIDHESD
ncbi:MAG: PAS domain S-box protein [Candidatus Krumholzibacteriota bacterium]|nr:PAS domain S-box protein [Candidatus Krumholzibacteriota bacterium]